jgi:hypothetical protein
MNTYGTRLGLIKQVLNLGYKDLLERLDNCATDRSLRNYIDNKTQMPANIISMVPEAFPEIDVTWWHSGDGQILKEGKVSYHLRNLQGIAADPAELYKIAQEGENVTIPASELFAALFKDMKEVNQLLKSRLEYYEVFMKNIEKYKI